ncbi:MAG: YfiR family protein [Bacteroidota bacterium]
MASELQTLAKSRKVKDLPLKVSKYPSIADAQGAHIVILSEKEKSQLQSAIDGANCENALIITEGSGLVKAGSCISLVVRDNKLTFEISKSNIESRSLNVSSQLLALGIEVD